MSSPPLSPHQSTVSPFPTSNTDFNDSFTALLGLPAPQALQLLHHPSPNTWHLPLNHPPSFPSPADPIPNIADRRPQRAVKMKEDDENTDKVKLTGKKRRNVEENQSGGEGEEKGYVHVRARRGQATDSHSLAERARREKINARMKLLQELVPGCSKISGTALVLEEIINHVQFLQRQVELLSMRLAAVNPTVDFSGLDNLLSAECGRIITCGNNSWPLSGYAINGHQYIDPSLAFIPSATSSTPTPVPCSSPQTPSLTYGCSQTN